MSTLVSEAEHGLSIRVPRISCKREPLKRLDLVGSNACTIPIAEAKVVLRTRITRFSIQF